MEAASSRIEGAVNKLAGKFTAKTPGWGDHQTGFQCVCVGLSDVRRLEEREGVGAVC